MARLGTRPAHRLPWSMSPVPLAGNYPADVAMALLALCPFIVLSTASLLIQTPLEVSLGTSRFGVELAAALANAGYAFGAVLAADLIQRVPKRLLYVGCEAGFAIGSVLCAVSPDVVTFIVGRLIEGVATGMLLVVALPPLVTNHGTSKLPLTAAFVNLGLFGMVTAGPLVGGVVTGEMAWRALFVGVAVLGAIGCGLGLSAFARSTSSAPGVGIDYSAVPVAAAATVLPFVAVSWLSRGSFTSPGFWLLLAFGLAALTTLLVRQYRKDEALMPLKLISHTLPVTGVAAAMLTGAAFTALIELSAVYLLMVRGDSPAVVGALLATQIVGIAVAAWLFKRVLPSRWLPALTFCGVGVTVLGGVLLLGLHGSATVPVVLVAAGLLGFGAGAGVAPGLFMGGLSVPSNELGPTFALVELLRSEAAFLIAPVLLAIAMNFHSLADGVHVSALILVVGTAACGAALLGLLLCGGVGPHAPDLEAWLAGDGSAFHSPPVAAAIRNV